MTAADGAQSTPSPGENTSPTGEPALIYDAGERRTHAEHAAEAYDFARRADTLRDMADAPPPYPLTTDEAESWPQASRGYTHAAEVCRERAQWHATMAVYELLRSQ